jgi:hypothetical protein
LGHHELQLPTFQRTCGVTWWMQWTISITFQVCIAWMTHSYARLIHVCANCDLFGHLQCIEYLIWHNTINTLVLKQFFIPPLFLQTSENEMAVAPLQNVFRLRTSKTFQLSQAPPYECLKKVLIGNTLFNQLWTITEWVWE